MRGGNTRHQLRVRLTRPALFAVAVILSACGGSLGSAASSASSLPLASADATHSPMPTPDPTVAATSSPAPMLLADDIAEVVTDDLVVRSLPEISDRSTISDIRLNQSDGHLLFVLGGPVAADGHDWYLVAPFYRMLDDIVRAPLPDVGWVAAGTKGEDWISPWMEPCGEPTLQGVRFTAPLLSLACFGDIELTFEGKLGACSYVVPGTVTPAWLTTEFCELYPEEGTFEIAGPYIFHMEPDDFELRDGPLRRVRVTGRFDHPAAQRCEHHPLEGEEPRPSELVVLGCRASFVATAVEGL